jgi:hypothetical protein
MHDGSFLRDIDGDLAFRAREGLVLRSRAPAKANFHRRQSEIGVVGRFGRKGAYAQAFPRGIQAHHGD